MNNTNPILSKYINDLDNCDTYSDVLKYCNRTFKNVLGRGSSRKVYKIPHFDLVVKVAMNDFGITQNKTEIKVYKKCKNKISIISKNYDYDKRGFKWLLSEYCYVNGCDENDDRMDVFIENVCGISGPLLRLLCTLCMSDKALSIINKNKKEFCDYTNWTYNSLDDLWRRRKENKKEYRKYLFQYIEKNFPNLWKESIQHSYCLHYYFITSFYHLRKIKPDVLFDYLFNNKWKQIQFIIDFRELTKLIGFDLLDSIDVGNMGIVRRDGKKYLVLLDYGYTEKNNMKQYSFLIEGIDKDNSYQDALKIFNDLTEEDKWKLCPWHGKYKNVPVLYRHVIKNKGFVDIYPHCHSKKVGFLLIATSNKYRGQGVTYQLMDKCFTDCKKLGIEKIWWVCSNQNDSSYHAALKNGFKLQKKGKTETRLYKEL